MWKFMLGALFGALMFGGQCHGAEFNPTHSPQISEWFQSLRQPDNPRTSCCGEADAFEADNWKESDGEYFAIITDGRGMLANGTAVRIPEGKNFHENKHNPTGHGIVFLHIVTRSEIEEGFAGESELNAIHVYCYLEPEGA